VKPGFFKSINTTLVFYQPAAATYNNVTWLVKDGLSSEIN